MRPSSEHTSFDPETATLVATFDNIGPSFYTNFHFASERLYKTASGKWFLEGQGGAMTRCGRISAEGPAVTRLTRSEVFDWLRARGMMKVLEQYF